MEGPTNHREGANHRLVHLTKAFDLDLPETKRKDKGKIES